jgi:uncharacterized protein (DUF2147 family)
MKKAMTIAAALMASSAGVPAGAADGDASVGVWRNASNSVHIESHHCGASMCGRVVWATPKAMADAKRGGTPNLLEIELFSDFRKRADGTWHGKVFVPDMNKTFSGTVLLVDHNTLKGTGCLFGGIMCRTQILTRIR